MKKDNDTKLTMKSFIDWSMNVQINNIKKATDEISLLKHWMINFDKMQPIFKNQVIRMINEKAGKNDFYDCFAPIDEVEE